MYNHDQIDRAITMAKRTRRICRALAREHCPHDLPDSVFNRISTRRKLYNFLESIDLSEDDITAIFHGADLPVPNKYNRRLKPSERAIEQLPAWLEAELTGNKTDVKIDVDWNDIL